MTGIDEKLKAELRLQAIEYLLCKLIVAQANTSGLPSETLDRMFRQFVEGADRQMFPGLEGAMSDHVTAEWRAAIERLVDAQKKMLAQARKTEAP